MDAVRSPAFGTLLKLYREARGLTQEALAERAEMSVRGLIYLEQGERRPYPHTVQRLAEALALAPSERANLADAARPLRATTPAKPSSISSPHTLPIPATPLIGRERETATVTALLQRADVRLLVLTGPGGVGKTRLAVDVAMRLTDLFADGVVFVPLAPLHDATLVAATIAQTLGVWETPDRPLSESLAALLRPRQALLLLDNLEHLLPAAMLVANLLATCPHLKVLVTSRAVLHVQGEHNYPVPPLAWPDPGNLPAIEALQQYPAVELFVQRARAAAPDFQLTAANAPAVAAICARLDGLPLAIELAAARGTLLPPHALLARLLRAYDYPPLRLLTGGARHLPPRLQTMHNAIAWSHDLLDTDTQVLFRRQAVFEGGCTLEAAEAVSSCGDNLDVLEGLAELVDQSLLRSEEIPASRSIVGGYGHAGKPTTTGGPAGLEEPGSARLVMLETIRAYALERLEERGESEVLRRQHAMYYLALAESAAPRVQGPEQGNWLSLLEADHDNLRSALRWAQACGEIETGLRLATALCRFWELRGHVSEGRGWLERLLMAAKPGSVATLVRARALDAAGTLAYRQGDLEFAASLLEESLTLARKIGNAFACAHTLNDLAMVLIDQGNYGRATALLDEALAIWRELGDSRGLSAALNSQGCVACYLGDNEHAAALLEESVTLARDVGDAWLIAMALDNLGLVIQAQGNTRRAMALAEESVVLHRALRNIQSLPYTLNNLGNMAHAQGDDGRAMALLRESLSLAQELGNKIVIAYALEDMAGVLCSQGQVECAVRLCGAAATLREIIGAQRAPNERASYENTITAAHRALVDDAFTANWTTGRNMSVEQAMAEAFTAECQEPSTLTASAAPGGTPAAPGRRPRQVSAP